jgi:hypothetical protein
MLPKLLTFVTGHFNEDIRYDLVMLGCGSGIGLEQGQGQSSTLGSLISKQESNSQPLGPSSLG